MIQIVPQSIGESGGFAEAHGGKFGTRLGDARVFSEIRKHYWWRRMRQDVAKWTQGCIVCTPPGVWAEQ